MYAQTFARQRETKKRSDKLCSFQNGGKISSKTLQIKDQNYNEWIFGGIQIPCVSVTISDKEKRREQINDKKNIIRD